MEKNSGWVVANEFIFLCQLHLKNCTMFSLDSNETKNADDDLMLWNSLFIMFFMYLNTGLFLFLGTLVGDSKHCLLKDHYYPYQVYWKCKAMNQQAASTMLVRQGEPTWGSLDSPKAPDKGCVSQSQHWHKGGNPLLCNQCSFTITHVFVRRIQILISITQTRRC